MVDKNIFCYFYIKRFLFNILFYSYFVLFTLVYFILAGLCFFTFFAFHTTGENRSRLRYYILLYGRLIIKYVIELFIYVKYTDKSIKYSKPCIYIFNHRSASDPFLVALLDDEMAQVVNRWPFKLPFYGVIAKKAEYMSILDLSYEEILKRTTHLLNKGVSIVVFPEGTRSGSNEMGQFNGTFFRIAKEYGCQIIPVCITGNEFIPDRSFKMHFGKIKVHKLKPITYDIYKEMTPFKLKNYVRRIMLEETQKMEAELENE